MMKLNAIKIGNWSKEEILGRGSFGEVSLWTKYGTKESVAIKICNFDTNILPTHEADTLDNRWLREIEILKNHSHEYLVKWIDIPEFMTNNNLKIIVMEYCELGDLRSQLCKIDNCNGFKESEVRNILKCLGQALKFLHDNKITHRDIKPENIVIKKVDGMKIYKLTDFGYAKQLENTAVASMVGTQCYLAPEIVLSGEYSYRVDYWSLGVVIFEVICGERPFSLDNYREFIDQIKCKRSDEIAITKDIKSEIKKHKHLFYENYLTFDFRKLMENWLQLALEYDSKLRGSENIRAELKNTFYLRLKDALKLKFLTVFSLWNYEFYSIPVNEETTLGNLYENLSNSTGLEVADLDIILPVEQISSLDKHPIISLYCFELNPMIFVATTKMGHSKNIKNLFLSELILQIINSHDVTINLTFLRKFARKVLFMVKNEQQYYATYLIGLNAYALEVNDRLCKLKPYNINKEAAQLSNSINLFEFLVHHSINLVQNYNGKNCDNGFIQKWENECNRKKKSLHDIINQISLFQREYDQYMKKSEQTVESKFLKEISHDHFDINKIESDVVKLLKTEAGDFDSSGIKYYKESFEKAVYDCIQKREDLLSSGLELLHNNINQCNEIYENLSNRFKVLCKDLKNQILDMHRLLALHQEELFSMKDTNITSITKNVKELSLTSFCFETTEDIKKLIEENENITLETSILFNETDNIITNELCGPKTLA